MTQVGTFDFTIFEKHMDIVDPNRIVQILRPIFKNWVFQYELTQKEILHIQGRGRVYNRMRVGAAVTFFQENDLKGHITPTSNPTHKTKKFNYVMKAQSRAPGTRVYSDEIDEEPKEKFSYITEYENYEEKRPFQQQLDDLIAEKPDRRIINLIVDPSGCSGKSLWQANAAYRHDALQIPDMTDSKDIHQFCISFKPSTIYMLNFPKAFDRRMRGAFGALESLKDGYLYETRYRGKIRYQEPPHVLVFANEVPDMSYLSLDRWRIWFLKRNYELEDVTDAYMPEYRHSNYESMEMDIAERRRKRKR